MASSLPHGTHVLLHCCCAPCSGAVIERLLQMGVTPTLFFYNPNIHPSTEYERRKNELIRYAHTQGIPCIEAEYDPERWASIVQGHESDPERGERCSLCFGMRLQRTAQYAAANGFSVIATTLGLSRRKDREQVAAAGRWAATTVDSVSYFDYDWRKGGGSQRGDEIARNEGFYRQRYCGCRFSHQIFLTMNSPL